MFNLTIPIVTFFVIFGAFCVRAQNASTYADILEMNEKSYKDQYVTIDTNLRKLPEELRPSMTIPLTPYPYTKWFMTNQEFLARNSDLIYWLITDAEQSIECKNPENSEQQVSDDAQLEKRALGTTDPLSIVARMLKYAKSKSGFKDCGLTDAEIAVIFGYTGGFYQTLNPALRKGYTDSFIDSFTKTLDHGLDKLKDFNGWVYRGVSLPASVRRQYVKGSIVSDLAYTSSGLNAGFFGRDQMHILSRTGKYIAPISKSPGENEVLFKRGTKFNVIEVHPDQLHPGWTDYTLEEVP